MRHIKKARFYIGLFFAGRKVRAAIDGGNLCGPDVITLGSVSAASPVFCSLGGLNCASIVFNCAIKPSRSSEGSDGGWFTYLWSAWQRGVVLIVSV